jgi:hypothetical protein
MKQRNDNVLNVSFACPANMAVGDVAVLDTTAAKTVKKQYQAGSLNVVGVVVAHLTSAIKCSIDTKFRERRDDRVVGSSFAGGTGPFVWDASMHCIPYDSATHDPSAIAGLVITKTASGACETLEY